GKDLLSSTLFRDADLVMPVPLHPKKLILRGYNQSEAFARGISSSMHIPILVKALVRTRSSETQTRKGRYNRWENVSGIFTVNNPSFLHDKHIILVDDVITTGATLEACAEELLAIPGIRLSLVAIAAVTA
ncbi:MAG: ComF family protein, partial [Bacteroidetes bacterium]|nr:ComF family protein [Bacteroidota bacterium]